MRWSRRNLVVVPGTGKKKKPKRKALDRAFAKTDKAARREKTAVLDVAGLAVEPKTYTIQYWRSGSGHRVSDMITSEYGMGLMARVRNWKPGWQDDWVVDFIKHYRSVKPEQDLYDTEAWDQEALDAFYEFVNQKRKQTKGKTYGNYGSGLSRERGSYRGS